MARSKYPLEALGKLREVRATKSTKELAHAISERNEAEKVREAARRVREEAERASAAVRLAERDALEAGALSAADLAQQHAWEMAVAVERAHLLESEANAGQKEEVARGVERAKQLGLARAKADAMVAEKHRQTWVREETKRADARVEADAEEAWRRKE